MRVKRSRIKRADMIDIPNRHMRPNLEGMMPIKLTLSGRGVDFSVGDSSAMFFSFIVLRL